MLSFESFSLFSKTILLNYTRKCLFPDNLCAWEANFYIQIFVNSFSLTIISKATSAKKPANNSNVLPSDKN